MDTAPYASTKPLPGHTLWNQDRNKRIPFSFTLELTARCNLNCRHCYINLPASDKQAKNLELSLEEIDSLASQAVKLGALWCLVTGGEPLLRKDFPEIYRMLKRKGLLVSVFTNACLINDEIIQLFKEYPPRDLEVTVYGISPETYEQVTRKSGVYASFRRGLGLLLDSGVNVRLKAVAIRSNVSEMDAIGDFCREFTSDFYRFDPLLHLRLDGNSQRNAEIQAERLSASEIVVLERSDPQRTIALQKSCNSSLVEGPKPGEKGYLLDCGAGINSFTIGYDGKFRLCEALVNPSFTYDLRQGNLEDAWGRFVPEIRSLMVPYGTADTHCWSCSLQNLCLWCPAHAALEFGQVEGHSPYFCQVAHSRAASLLEQAAPNPD